MAQNHYQWTSERVTTTSSPSKKEAGMHEISSLDHPAAKVDTLTQKFDKMNTSVVTPAPGKSNLPSSLTSSYFLSNPWSLSESN